MTRLSLYLAGPGQSSGKQLVEVKWKISHLIVILDQASDDKLGAIVVQYPNMVALNVTGEQRTVIIFETELDKTQ